MCTTLSPSSRAARGVARRRRRFSMLRIDPATVTPTWPRPFAPPRVAAGTLAAALLLCLPGTGLAAGRPDGGDPPAQSGSPYESIDSSSRVLARGTGYAVDGGSAPVRQLQIGLRNGAYEPGPVDGLYGPLTDGAVRRFQQAHGLTIDGVVGPQTHAALRTASFEQGRAPPATRPGAGYGSAGGSARVLEVQRMLSSLRYETGGVDGLFGPRTQAAVQWFQVRHGFRPTGIADQATQKRLRALTRGSPGIRGAAASSELVVPPVPAAGWHGRPIRNPLRHPGHAALESAGRGDGRARPLRPGAGYRSAAGSQRVRRVQRELRRLGYRPGPVDGLFGPRTKAAVQWFQMKQGLRPRGTVDAATAALLRGFAMERNKANASVLRPRAARPPRASTQPSPGTLHADGTERGGGISLLLVLLGAAFGAAVLSLMALTRTRARRAEPVPQPPSTRRAAPTPADPHAGAGGGESPAPAPPRARRQQSPCVVGYASAQDPAELERQAAAIERACHDRGWTLACVIQENGTTNGNGRSRPGLAQAVKQVREGPAGRLVVESIERLGDSQDEIRAQLTGFSDDDIDLVALHASGNPPRKPRRPKRVKT
jgi:peptidoglycan hydrolase-like protein with peptidoglycan-binding domain